LRAEGVRGFVAGAQAERAEAETIAAAAGEGWANAAGEGSILFAAELLRAASVALGNDSGGLHLAAAAGVPCVALIGSTEPRWTAPLGAGHLLVRSAEPCAPCFARTCPRGEPAPCMAAIALDTVIARVRAQLAQTRGGSCFEGEVGGEGMRESSGGQPGMRCARDPALFLDRDGTLLALVEYLDDPARARLQPGAAEALRRARAAGFRLVVVSNQSGVARGLFPRARVAAVHAAVRRELAAAGAEIDAFSFCPHHPEHTGPCTCRKPEPGMLLEAATRLDLDRAASFMIGDTVEDLLAGVRAGCRPVLVRSGYGARQAVERAGEIPPHALVADDLRAAVAAILARDGEIPPPAGTGHPRDGAEL